MRVVSGALVREGRVLMGLRKSTGMRPDLWELPGGKVEQGEDYAAALAREWMEEVGVSVRAAGFIAITALSVEIGFSVELYQVVAESGYVPRALDHQKLAWVDPLCAVKWLPCSPAFYAHFSELRRVVETLRSPMHRGLGCLDEACVQCRSTREAFLDDLAGRTIHR